MKQLAVKIVTPQGEQKSLVCDSLRLSVADNANERGGGSYGIRPGHVDMLLALEEGELSALLAGKLVLEGRCGNGFATVEKNVVTVVAEFFETKI